MERNLESGLWIKVRIWRGNRVGRVFRYLSTARSTLGFIVVVLRSKSAGEMREGVVNPRTVSSQVREIPSFEHLDFPSFYIFPLFFSISFFFFFFFLVALASRSLHVINAIAKKGAKFGRCTIVAQIRRWNGWNTAFANCQQGTMIFMEDWNMTIPFYIYMLRTIFNANFKWPSR